jgi:hypothetical protein
MTQPLQPRNHVMAAADAARITARHRALATVAGARAAGEGDLGGLFSRDAIEQLMSQPGAAYLRFYYGRNDRGGRELVLVAADQDGNDLLDQGAVALDSHWPCPPFCPPSPSALRG